MLLLHIDTTSFCLSGECEAVISGESPRNAVCGMLQNGSATTFLRAMFQEVNTFTASDLRLPLFLIPTIPPETYILRRFQVTGLLFQTDVCYKVWNQSDTAPAGFCKRLLRSEM